MKHLFLKVFGTILFCFAGNIVCSARAYEPVSQNSFTGAGTFCQGTTAGVITFTYNTCNEGGGGATGDACRISWYTNTTNSTNVGTATLVSGPTNFNSATAATGTQTYTPPTTIAGALYYFCVVTRTVAGCDGVTANSTLSSSTALLVTIHATPTSTGATNNGPICNGSNVTLSANSTNATGWSWRGSDGTSSAVQNPVMTPTATTTYSLTVTNTDGCTNATVYTTTAIVHQVPSSTGATNNGPICNGSTVTLFDHSTNATAWSWTGSDGTSSNVESPTFTPTATTTYSLTVTNTDGCVNATVYPTTVVVNILPTSTGATNSSPICDGTNVTLSANSTNATGWSWTGSDGTSSAVQNPVMSPTATTTYSLTVTNTDGCTNATAYTTIVTVNVVPTSTGATNDGPICDGTNVTLSANSMNATSWSWTGSDGTSSVAQNPVMSPTATTTYSLTLSNTDGCNNIDVFTTVVSVNATPTSSGATNSSPICDGTNVTLSANSMNATSWSWTGSDGTSSTAENPVMSPSVMTTYSLTMSNSDGCTNTTVYTTIVTVNVVPTSSGATNDGPICDGTNVTLSANSMNATSWSWTGSDGTSSVAQNPVMSPTATTTYSLTVSNTDGCNNIDVFTTVVSVNVVPTSTGATNDGPICNGGSVTLSANSMNATSWSWTGSDGTSSVAQNPVMSPTATTTYSLTVSNTDGCSNIDVFTTVVSVNATPTSSGATNSSPICDGTNVTLSANSTNATGWSWTGSDGTSSAAQNPVMSPSVTTTYSLTVSNTDGCTNATAYTTIVTVNVVPTSTGATNDGPICNGGSVTLSANSMNTTSWSWTGSDGTSSVAQNPVMSPTATTTYSLTVSNTDGCDNLDVFTTVVSVNATPASSGATNSSPICDGTNVTLSANSTNATGWSWTGSDGTSSSAQNPVMAPSVTTTYSLTVSNTDGCTNATAYTTIVTVNVVPTSTGATNDGPICNGGSVTLSANSMNTTSWSWTGSDGTSSVAQNPVMSPTATTTYSLTVSNTDGCDNIDVFTTVVSVNVVPASSGATNDGPICNGGSVTLSANSMNTTSWSWTGSDGTSSAAQNPVMSPTATTTYSLTVSNTDGCDNIDVFTTVVSVNVVPASSGATNDGPICNGGSVTLSANSTNATGWLWTGSDGTSSAAQNPVMSPTATTTYSLTVSNTDGCGNIDVYTTVVSVNATPNLYVLSPGGGYCAGSAGVDITLSYSDIGVSYQLYNGTTLVDTLAGIGGTLNFGEYMASGTYTVLATNNTTGCMSNMSGSASVTMNPLPTAYMVTGGGSYCAGGAGENVGLSWSDGGVSYQLYADTDPVGGTVPGIGGALNFGLFTEAGSYVVVATNDATGCQSLMADSATIIINPLPGPIDGTTSICLNTSTTLSDGSSGGTWSSNDVGIASIDPSLGLMTGVASGMATITYTLPTTCAITTTVTVNALPVVAAITGVTNECAGMGNTLADATASGVWSSGNTAIATIDPVLGTVNGLMAGIVTMSYTVTNSSGCIASATTADTVNALPVVDAISGSMNVCVNSMVTLADDSIGGVWASSDITIATIDASGNVTGIAAGNTTITYTVTNTAGCIAYVTAMETVDPLPTVAGITGMMSACAGTNISLSDVTPGGVWSSSNASIATVDATGMVSGIAAGNASISYMVTSAYGCVTTVMYNVAIGTPIPASSIAPTGNVTLCNATPINLVLTTAGSGLTYQWLEDGSDIAGATNGSYITDTTGLFTVILNNGVCSDTLAGTTVLPPPNPVISYNSSGDYLYTGTFATYQWFKNGTPITGANSSILVLTGAGTYKVVVSDADGCYVTSASYDVTGGGGSTGVNNSPTATSVKIYPNPATSILQIDAPVIVNVSVISPDGKLVIEQKQATSIDVSQLADGLYIIMIYDENNALISTDKFAKTN